VVIKLQLYDTYNSKYNISSIDSNNVYIGIRTTETITPTPANITTGTTETITTASTTATITTTMTPLTT
jgi:hypothetical protein